MSRGDSLYHPNRRLRRMLGPLFGAACFLATLTGVFVLVIFLASILYAALGGTVRPIWDSFGQTIRDFVSLMAKSIQNRQSSDPAIAGFRVGLVGTLWLLGLVAAIGIPVGIGAGLFLEEYAPPGRLKRIVQTNISNLAGVPSIVYGILGLALFVRAFGVRGFAMGPSLLAGALTLGLLILPTIVITTQEALRAVPSSLRQAALALGATRWQVISGHVLPAALPGIMTGAILGLSRVIGETAPLLMVGAAGSILRLPKGPLDRYTALPVEIYNYAKEPDRQFQVITAGGILILMLLLLTMNATAILIRNRFRRGR